MTLRQRRCGLLALGGVLASMIGLSVRADGVQPALMGTLLYSRLTEGIWQLWQTDLHTGIRTQLTFSSGDKRSPAWTPDGRILYQTGNQQCYLMRQGKEPGDPILADLWPVRDLAWAPDGSHLICAKLSVDLVETTNLWIVDLRTQARQMLTREPGLQHQAAWSPDASRIAYIAGKGYRTLEIYVMNPDGSERRQLTQNRAHEFSPAWSPDGTRLAFSSDASGDYEIWLMDVPTLTATQLTVSAGLDTDPAWSPDGHRIAFTTNRSGRLELWVMRTDGSEQQPLEQAEGGGVCDPAWRR